MTDEELREKALARFLKDMQADHRMTRQCWSKAECHRIQADVFTELALKYLVDLLEAQDENAGMAKTIDTLRKDHKAAQKMRDEAGAAILENIQLKSDIHTIMSKLQRLQPGGSPPPSGSPVLNTYWIVDHILNNGYFPELKA